MINAFKNSAIKLIIILILTIFVGEWITIFLNEQFLKTDGLLAYIFKPSILVLLSSPVIYYLIYIPESKRVFEQGKVESQLQIANSAAQISDALMITDSNGSILKVNQAFEEMTGYSMNEVLGKNPRILNSGHHDSSFYLEMWDGLLNDGIWKGVIWDKSKSGVVYPKYSTITAVKDDIKQTTNYVAVFTAIFDQKETEDEIYNLAFYDSLTALPNRRLLLDRLSMSISASERSKTYGAVMFLDLDHFKEVNDTLGHQYGDMLLVEVAQRLKSCFREIDTVARLGGDEFVVLLDSIGENLQSASENAEKLAEKARLILCKPYLNNKVTSISASIGVSLFIDHNFSVDQLLENTDIAMYQSKRLGRNRVCLFKPSMAKKD
jgi:diguanylate cyclase (GGDEF)-like protein/PAS domain S-box-containing protein